MLEQKQKLEATVRTSISSKINLYGFVIFDKDVAVKVYGKPLSPQQQLLLLGEEELSQKMDKIPAAKSEFTSDQAFNASKFLKGKVKGLVFTGRRDGRVAVIYDPSSVVPVTWKKTKDGPLKQEESKLLRDG